MSPERFVKGESERTSLYLRNIFLNGKNSKIEYIRYNNGLFAPNSQDPRATSAATSFLHYTSSLSFEYPSVAMPKTISLLRVA